MNQLRADWREFICSPNRPYRYLSGLGAAVQGAKSDPLDLADLENFLQKLQDEADVKTLAEMVDLIGGGYLKFMDNEFQFILDRLANEMLRRDEVVGPGLRGNPRWDRTSLGRLTHTLRPGMYFSRTAVKSYELPENLLLRWLVNNLAASVTSLIRLSAGRGVHPILAKLLSRCQEAASHHWFSTLPVPTTLTAAMKTAANRSRQPEFRAALELANMRDRLTTSAEGARWHAILMLLAVGWLEPIDDDDIFELFALTLALDVISTELGFGEPYEYGLVATGRAHVAAFESDSGKLRVFFDQSPTPALRGKTRYQLTLQAHRGVTGAARRPDISILLERPNATRRFVIIEAKRTVDERYTSDSIYKMFSYLHDYRAAWDDDQTEPRAILIVPEGVAPENMPALEVAVVSGTDRAALVSALATALEIE